MQDRELIESRIEELRHEFGEWTYDIPLPCGVWTKGNLNLPHTRLKRILQVTSDLSKKPLSECRILDMGCLEGMFSIEFALHGAQTIGVDIREANIKKAMYCKEVLRLHNLDFRQDDARNISIELYGKFDAIICSGLLYHLPANDVFALLDKIFEMVETVVVLDTHVALEPKEHYLHNGFEYWGHSFGEHRDGSTQAEKAKSLLASWDNQSSFWFTRPSLINALNKTGFSSVYECFIPAHINFGKPGIEHNDRCTFVAIKGDICKLSTSPTANGLFENWPENSLSYAAHKRNEGRRGSFFKGAFKRLRRLIP